MREWFIGIIRGVNSRAEDILSGPVGPSVSWWSKLMGAVSAAAAGVQQFVASITVSDVTLGLSLVGALFFTAERYYSFRIRRKEWQRVEGIDD